MLVPISLTYIYHDREYIGFDWVFDIHDLTESNNCFFHKYFYGKELAVHAKDTLTQMLVKQKVSTNNVSKILWSTLNKHKLNVLDANHQWDKMQTTC